ncbi:APC family permease [Legionella sp. W05-934-2]|jgi:amino acid transporter|uniref:APC family permease n=1 Tax=Legionella sp. W05-934-2 TaxID=1198649 RepID=UPI003462A6D7
MKITRSSDKPLSVFTLVMINIIAVDSLRTLPISAAYGFSLVFYYLIAAFLFFIPVALVSAELATAMPKTGGIYIWVKQAFGQRAAFITIWLQWIYNVVWYPTIMVFVVVTLATLTSPMLVSNKGWMLLTVNLLFWLFTLLNCFGMRISGFVSILGAIVGTLLPMVIIISLGIIWLLQGHPVSIQMDWQHFFPHLMDNDNNELILLGGILFGLVGMEMSAVHAGDVENPQKDYPKALLWSTIIIILTLVMGSLAIAMVVPNAKLSLVSGLMEAFAIFFNSYHLPWMTQVVACFIIIGALSSVSAWIIGPTRGLMVAAEDGCLPHLLAKTNRFGAPVNLLMVQAGLLTLLSSVYVLFDDINVSYWLLSDLTAQMALLVYVMMFFAFIELRQKHLCQPGRFTIPGNLFAKFIALCGLIICLLVISTGFIPPKNLSSQAIWFYEAFLIVGLSGFILIPLSWQHRG